MTLVHVVLFKIKPVYPAAVFELVTNGFKNMHEHIPHVQRVTFGKNLTERGRGYTHEIDSFDNLKKYIEHPHHVELATKWKQCIIAEDTMALDYEA